ncbi:unnamed protein product [marine sediment metagenome]|uniref:Uncharacterized protein n=1 Tax=marine sediment metagenome TaxID=412755 RepID=X0YB45_9ZZZZ
MNMMNNAYIQAQIEQLEMALDRIFNDADLMKIEIGRLRAGVGVHPGESWQTEDAQPDEPCRPADWVEYDMIKRDEGEG